MNSSEQPDVILYLSPKHYRDLMREITYPVFDSSFGLENGVINRIFNIPVEVDPSVEGSYVEFY